jgi:hypothetical protein
MANTEIVQPLSAKLINLVRPIVAELCSEYEWENGKPFCVTREQVAKRLVRDHREELPRELVTVPKGAKRVASLRPLYHLIGAAVDCGQVPGFACRIGRNGGIYKVPAAE